ncbi:Hypothetical protein FKW44_018645 [Caligus rogercresseyi]|uniref:Uncharacterized protein n=1 Tax=Caligus rogercresseyi TaxID=217165 RepID=A0A7T8GUR3_CALRO|nr:Hypothetical protein FKW44_018645 [Caligus rogercresseyi]
MAAWKAVNLPNSPRSDVLCTSDFRTRGGRAKSGDLYAIGCSFTCQEQGIRLRS